MSEKDLVLCVSNAYKRMFYIGPEFENLPTAIKEELQIISVLFTEDVGGILKMYFDEDGNLEFETECEEGDYFYDEIGSVLKIKQYRNEKSELFEALETYYRVFILGEQPNE